MFIEPAECVVFRTVPIACRTLALELNFHTQSHDEKFDIEFSVILILENFDTSN
jgi:hypothetical protein